MMRMARWFPDSRLLELRRETNDMFNRMFGPANGSDRLVMPGTWTPETEGFRENGHYVIRVALPGVDPKDIDVSITDKALWIKGERKMRDEVERDDYFVQEFDYGTFERVFALPADGEGVKDKTRAKWNDGVLEVRVPMTQAAAPKKLSVEVGRGSPRAARAA